MFQGLSPHGFILVDSKKSLIELGLAGVAARLPHARVRIVDATSVAEENLGRPLSNVALLGSFASLTGIVSLAAVVEAIMGRFRGKTRDGNAAAARAAYELVTGDGA